MTATLATCFMMTSHVVAQDAADTVRVVVLGDSLSAGYGLPRRSAFPETLERALQTKGYRVEMINAGVSGDTASGGLERVDWSVPEGTDGVILQLGANDMLRGIDPKVTRNALENTIKRLKDRGIEVMLAGMLAAPNLGADYAQRFEAIYTDLAKTYDLTLYPFFLDGVAGDRKLNLPDGIHPTAQGIERIVERIVPTVERFLARLGASRA